MYKTFNINSCVRVKLTEKGKQEYNWIAQKEDKDGYLKFKMWELIHIFGCAEVFSPEMLPFEPNILIDMEE